MPISTSWSAGPVAASTPTRFVIYGRGLSRNYINNLATISEIEALPDQRLYNAYFEQSFFNDRLNIRAGQQAADVEFFDSQTDDLFINGTFGWPAIKATNLPAGGPAPPIAVPGIRIKAALTETSPRSVRCSTAIRQVRATGSAAARQSWSRVSRQRSAVGDRAGPLRLRHRYRRPPARRQFHAGRLEALRLRSTASALRRRACRSPIPAEAAFRQSFAAITESSRSSSRCSIGRRR